jgi:hypothetical protein
MEESYLVRLKLQGADGVEFRDDCLLSCKSAPTSLSIPKGVLDLKSGCLSGQPDLERVSLPSTLIHIGDACFANCPNLRVIKCYPQMKPFEETLKYGNKAEVVYVNTQQTYS